VSSEIKPQKSDAKNVDRSKLGKLIDKFKVRVSGNEYIIELFNHDITDEALKIYSVLVNGKQYSVEVETLDLGTEDESVKTTATPVKSATKAQTPVPMAKPVSEPPAALKTLEKPTFADSKTLTAPMPGKIIDIKVKVNDHVEAGQPIVILEAMKMENVMTAPASGIVKEIPIETGINVNQGDILVAIE
jgi:glutaconyl-CoA decarboxylase